MKKEFTALFGIFLISTISISAHDFSKPNVQLSYYGDMIFHPGIKLAYQHPIKHWEGSKTKKDQTKLKYKSIGVGAQMSSYVQTNHHVGLLFLPSIFYERSKPDGRFFQSRLGAGVHQSFISGITYEVDNNDNVSEKSASQTTGMVSLDFGFGKDLSVKKDIPLRYVFGFGLNGRWPYNKSFLPGLHLELGFHYLLKGKK